MSSKPDKPQWRDFFGEKRREGLKAPEIAELWKTYKVEFEQNKVDKRKERVNRAKEFFQKHNQQQQQQEPSPVKAKAPEPQPQPQASESDSEPAPEPVALGPSPRLCKKPTAPTRLVRKNMKEQLEAQSKVTENLTKRCQQLPINDSSDDESVRVNLKTLKSLIKHRRG